MVLRLKDAVVAVSRRLKLQLPPVLAPPGMGAPPGIVMALLVVVAVSAGTGQL